VTTRLQGLPPVISAHTRLLILGSFPGVASLQAQQYYGHPRNHFWPIVGSLLGLDLLVKPYADRLQVLRDAGLGLWDVYASCHRVGSLDQAIEDAALNDFSALRNQAPQLTHIAHNGGESARVMRQLQALGFVVTRLPSTSPANASWSFQRKLGAWRLAFVAAGVVTAASAVSTSAAG
jgi:hypoxanthine-DNA glycosylase